MAANISHANLPLESIRPSEDNVRIHSDDQIRKIAESMKVNGFGAPILVNERRVILSGHGRYEAATLAGLDSVPAIIVSGLSADEERAFRLADNRIHELSSWDYSVLKADLQTISDECAAGAILDESMAGILAQLNSSLDELTRSPKFKSNSAVSLDDAEFHMDDCFRNLGKIYAKRPAHVGGRSILSAIDASWTDRILSDPELSECSEAVRELVTSTARRLTRIDFVAVAAYYQDGASPAMRDRMEAHRAVIVDRGGKIFSALVKLYRTIGVMRREALVASERFEKPS